MFQYYLFFTLFVYVFAFEPSCTNCKFYVPNTIRPDLGLCNMFQDSIYHNNKQKLVKNLAIHCRANENLCGKSGFLFESNDDDKSQRFENYEYIKSVCSNEFVEAADLNELEQIEKDLVEVFQRMRRHNTKMLYKTPDQIYKLFNNNKKDI